MRKPDPADPGASEPEVLAVRAAAGCAASFEALVLRYQGSAYAYACRHVRDGSEAQDVTQEIFLRLYSRLDRFDPNRRFEPWFWRLAGNVCRNYSRRRIERPGGEIATAQADQSIHAGEGDLWAALRRLKREDRLVLVLYYHAGLPVPDIAHHLGVGAACLRTRLHRARTELRRLLLAAS